MKASESFWACVIRSVSSNTMDHQERQFTELKIQVPWGHVAARVYGNKKGRKVLMVHGHLDNCGTFHRLLQLLPEEYEYVCIDLPGHGFSSHFPEALPLEFFNYVYTIHLVLQALKWTSCFYIGHSLGAHVGVYYSSVYPGKVQKLMALDGLLPKIVHDNKVFGHIQLKYELDRLRKDVLHTKESIMYALQFKRQSTLNIEAAEALFERAVTKVGDLYKYTRDSRLKILNSPTMNANTQLNFLERIKIPVLLIAVNDKHRWEPFQEVVTSLMNRKPNNYQMISVSGNHDVHNNNPERVAPYLCDFMNSSIKSNL